MQTMNDRLAIFECREGYGIVWVVDGEDGAEVGDFAWGQARPKDPDDVESWLVYHAAKPLADGRRSSRVGFRFSTKRRANEALRAIRAALRADRDAQKNKPWPEWAVKAAEAGWRAPKGWSP